MAANKEVVTQPRQPLLRYYILLQIPVTGPQVMSTSGGLSRRRVGANGGATSSYDDDDGNKLSHSNSGGGGGGGGSRSTTPVVSQQPQHAHAGSAFEGGNKIAFDPRDLQQDATEEARTGGRMPRLTIMEEVLLLGIKDKQVTHSLLFFFSSLMRSFLNLFFFCNFVRVIYLSGTITFHTSYVAVFLSN